MSNPALELHELYASWRTRVETAGNAATAREHLRIDNPQGMAEIRRAFALLTAIDGILRRFEVEGKRVEPFRSQRDGWARVPLSLPAGWTSNVAPDHLINGGMLQQIESFGAYLEGKVLVLDAGQHTNLRSVVDQADALLNDEDFDPVLRQYLRRLIAEIRYALDDEQAGRAFDFEDAVERLWTAFAAASARAPEPQRAKWRQLLDQIMVGVVSGGSIEAASLVVQAITQNN